MEIWRDIQGYEGLYQISNYGKVKSLYRIVKRSGITGPYQTVGEKILANRPDGKGYLQVRLYKDGHSTYPKIHRLVAIHFLGEAPSTSQVNHKDRNKKNNCVDNLEWIDIQGNMQHSFSKYYEFISPLGEYYLIFNLNKFCKEKNLSVENMHKVFNGKRNHHKGWKKYEE